MDNCLNMDFGNAFRKIEKGKCRISMNGRIAIQTGSGYRTFDPATGTLTNCSSFVTNMGDEFFYVVPAAKVKRGDIVLIGGLPRCVVKYEKKLLTVMTYETGTVETIIPERHMFMGNIYFFNKITCPMLGMFGGKGKMNRMVRMMMLNDMMTNGAGKGNSGNAGGGMNFMQMLMMQGMMKETGNAWDDMFSEMDDEEDTEETGEEETEDMVTDLFN